MKEEIASEEQLVVHKYTRPDGSIILIPEAALAETLQKYLFRRQITWLLVGMVIGLILSFLKG